MYKSAVIKVWLVIIVLMSPWAVHAAGLGKLTVNSALGQPFKAEIELIAVKKEDIFSLTARLASRDAFRKANIDYASFLSTFAISVEARSDGQPYIRIISLQPVVEPFLSMLIELNWASGRLLREYTVLLDLPETDIPQLIAPTTQVVPTQASVAASEPVMVEKPDAPIKDFVSDKKPAVREPTPVGRTGIATGTTYGPVRSGDTLSKIARQTAPPGVSLNQMLIALHRTNRDAFSGNNINRLKAGPILQLPDSSEIARISAMEANVEVKTQIADWNVYRQKLAEAAAAVPVTGAPKQMASGKITTIVEDNAAAVRGSSKEVLKLSKGEELGGAAGGKGGDAARDHIRAMEEDAVARSKALNEANQRITLLEKNIKEMQHLLELKSTNMAEAQKRAEGIKLDAATSSAPVVSRQPAAAPVAVAPVEPEETVVPDSSSTEAVKPAVESVAAVAAPLPAPVKPSLMDSLVQNIEYVGGGLALLLAGILGVSMMSRKKTVAETYPTVTAASPVMLDDEEALSVAATPVLEPEPAPVPAPEPEPKLEPAVPEPEMGITTVDVDPITEAELYLSYGRDTQAEKTLKEALAKDPNRPEILAKLLEVYVLREDNAAFEATARTLQAVSPSGSLWEKAVRLGTEIDPGNPLYVNAVATNSNVTESVKLTETTFDFPQNMATEEMNSVVDEIAGLDSGMEFSSHDSNPKSPATDDQSTKVVAATEDMGETMFDLDIPAMDAVAEVSSVDDMAFDIDFPAAPEYESEAKSEPEAETVAAPAPAPVPVPVPDSMPSFEQDLTDIDLNLGEPPPALSTDPELTQSTRWHEIATKIDLARAYQEMGDNEGAREILEEVMREGDDGQRESARIILGSI